MTSTTSNAQTPSLYISPSDATHELRDVLTSLRSMKTNMLVFEFFLAKLSDRLLHLNLCLNNHLTVTVVKDMKSFDRCSPYQDSNSQTNGEFHSPVTSYY